MGTGSCRVELIEGIRHNENRAIAFLEYDEIEWVNAKAVFDELKEKHKRALLTRFDYWLSGAPGVRNKRYFHGWNLSQYGGKYTSCFVFKLPVGRTAQRFYGFLEHPFKNHKTVLCVLAVHTIKDQWETEENDLKHIVQLKSEKAVCEAIKNQFYRI